MSLTPVLQSSGFSDPDAGDSHAATQWQLDDNSDFSNPLWDYLDTDLDKVSQAVPSGVLSGNTTYYVRVRHQDSGGAWSEWSISRSFTTTSGLQPVYRFWSPVFSHHFFTMNAAERDKLINDYSNVWQFEGVAYYTYENPGQPGVLPVYRFWSAANGGHFYTINPAERDNIISKYANVWTYEGIAWYAYPASFSTAGKLPVYRFWSPRKLISWINGVRTETEGHFFTTSVQERDKIINDYPDIWTYEGMA